MFNSFCFQWLRILWLVGVRITLCYVQGYVPATAKKTHNPADVHTFSLNRGKFLSLIDIGTSAWGHP